MFSTYILVSALSLVVDWLLLVVLTTTTNVNPGCAAAIAYLLGAAVHYMLSRRHVFRSRATGRAQLREALWYMASCLCGAALTATIVAILATVVGAVIAKSVATAISFVVLYGLRRFAVFAGGSAREPMSVAKRAAWVSYARHRSGSQAS